MPYVWDDKYRRHVWVDEEPGPGRKTLAELLQEPSVIPDYVIRQPTFKQKQVVQAHRGKNDPWNPRRRKALRRRRGRHAYTKRAKHQQRVQARLQNKRAVQEEKARQRRQRESW